MNLINRSSAPKQKLVDISEWAKTLFVCPPSSHTLGALVPCAQEVCPHLRKQTDEPIWKDGEGRDVYLRLLTPL